MTEIIRLEKWHNWGREQLVYLNSFAFFKIYVPVNKTVLICGGGLCPTDLLLTIS